MLQSIMATFVDKLQEVVESFRSLQNDLLSDSISVDIDTQPSQADSVFIEELVEKFSLHVPSSQSNGAQTAR